MKKFLTFIAVFILILSNVGEVQARTLPQAIQSNLSIPVAQVKVGETITLTAKTLKKGSGYIEQWDGAQLSKTYLDESMGNYVSEAQFTPNQAGTYTITYTVQMYTGNNELKFISSASKTIEVISDVKEVIGLEVINVNAYPNTNADGSIRGYSVLGELNVLWSDNTSTPYGTVAYFFLPNEKSRVVNPTVNINSQEYSFPVTISINP